MFLLALIDILAIFGFVFFTLDLLSSGFFIGLMILLFFKGLTFYISSHDYASAVDCIVALYGISLLYFGGNIILTMLAMLFLLQKVLMLFIGDIF